MDNNEEKTLVERLEEHRDELVKALEEAENKGNKNELLDQRCVLGKAFVNFNRAFYNLKNNKMKNCSKSQWISCSEKLPEDDKDYLLYCKDTGEQFVGFYVGKGRFQTGKVRTEKNRVIDVLCEPSYWRELPDPPEVKE